MDVWRLNDSKTFTGSIVLEGGHVYDLRIDYFNDMLEGEIKLFWIRPDAKKPLFGGFGSDPGEPITARYFKQSTPPVSIAPKPAQTPPVVVATLPAKPVTRPPVVASILPKPVSKRPTTPQPEPVAKPVATVMPASEAVADPPVATPMVKAPPVVDKPTVLQHVQFEQSSYILLSQSFPELDKLVQMLRANPTWRIELIGHTDNVGDPRVNQTLSEYRARVVMNYLSQRGIAEARIDTKGYGGSRPIAGNDTEANRAMNRRVEFVLK
jgi:outer membrane protein OmpA-like peptidoglycan-associated protein